jgi:hypothetical protein
VLEVRSSGTRQQGGEGVQGSRDILEADRGDLVRVWSGSFAGL